MTVESGIVEKRIGLALSGGGVRAAAFHAGVLRYLAEKNSLGAIAHISSVSGGSLFTGLVFSASGYQWPTSSRYLSEVLPRIRMLLTTLSLQGTAIRRLLANPLNWKFLLSRANVVAKTIEDLWGINVPLSALSATPVWSINGTTAETGLRFRFKGGRMGDYELGYAHTSEMSLASAMAVSAAFPGGIGPLALKPEEFQWSKRESWNSTTGEKPYKIPFSLLHIYDGGLYDNLGIEPLFDIGRQELKTNEGGPVDFLIVADAGAALSRSVIPHPLNPLRFKRIADIALAQTRALRVRAFVNFLNSHPSSGLYLQLGAYPTKLINQYVKGREEAANRLLAEEWLDDVSIKKAATFPTTLYALHEKEFELICKHGYETAKCNAELFETSKI